MKKKILLRGLIGAPVGIAISYIITVLISVLIGDGRFYAVSPQLAVDFGGELSAVIWQTICSVIFGAAFACSSVIWEMENWSLLKMTITHLAVVSVCSFPIAYVMRWIPHTVIGFVIYCSVFFGIYLCIWISQYSYMKKKIAQLNSGLTDTNK